MADREVLVTRIEAAPSATIQKVAGYTPSKSRYIFPIIYHLADGTTVCGTSKHNLLRDAKKELASLPKKPDVLTHAMFGPDGQFWGTKWTIGIGDLLASQARL